MAASSSRRGGAGSVAGALDSAALAAALREPTALLVLDVHAAWCGATTVLDASYRKLAAAYGPRRLRLHSVEAGLLPAELLGGAAGAAALGSCKPLLLLVRGGRVVSRVQGASAPELEAAVSDAVPAAAEGE